MRSRTASGLIACAALALSGGCGQSGGAGQSASSTASSGAGATASSAIHNSASSLSVPPKYATPASAQPIRSGLVQIAYRNITIAPDTLRVRVGSTIRWTNYDAVQHNVTSEHGPARFRSGNFGQGGSFAVKLTRPGLLQYECSNHPASMNGAIEVVG